MKSLEFFEAEKAEKPALFDALAERSNEVEVFRYFLAEDSEKFTDKPVINARMALYGTETLPIVLLNGEIIKTGAYPTFDELKENCKNDRNRKESLCACQREKRHPAQKLCCSVISED